MRKALIVLGIIILFFTPISTLWNNSFTVEGNSIIWQATLYANETSGKSDYAVIGEATDANDGMPPDAYDVVKPPAPITDYIRLLFYDNLASPYDELWKDYRNYPSNYKVWNLSILWLPSDNITPTTVTISWNSTALKGSEYHQISFCNEAGIPLQNMFDSNYYTFSCPANTPQNYKIICAGIGNPPYTPSTPSGETFGYHGIPYKYTTNTTDPDGDDLYYQFDWGDGTLSSWLGPYHSNEIVETTNIWQTPGDYQVKVIAKDTNGVLSNWSLILPVKMTNRAPSQPTAPSPQNKTANVPLDVTLSWTSTDPDNDLITYDVYFGTNSSPAKIVSHQSNPSFHLSSLQYQTTYFWKIISWDTFGGNTSSPLWLFTTASSGGGQPGEPGGGPGAENQPPVANVSVSDRIGFIGNLLVFNASRSHDSDGYITKWLWDFGDGTNGSGEVTIHTYYTIGIYTVTLTVFDEKNATGSDTLVVEIISANLPPDKPMMNGPTTGTKNRLYTFSVYSIDLDNDFLQYTIDWGDSTHNTSNFLPNGTIYSFTHAWAVPGRYTITASASDNTTLSEPTTHIIYIDAKFVQFLGYLLDIDNDSIYDVFYYNDTGISAEVQRLTNGTYLLDRNDQGQWKYLFNPITGALTILNPPSTAGLPSWVFFTIILCAIVVIAVIVYFYKKGYF
jgi:PKD repeat protein